jgi:signal transduction histidine kinase
MDRLSAHRTLGSAPRAELEWLAAHGTVRTLATGDLLSVKGQPVAGLYIVLGGRLALFIDRGSGPNKLVEWREGDIAGLLPYSRLSVAPGNSEALEPSQVLAIARDQLQSMTRECFEVTSILVHTMVDRTRMFTSNDLQNEKMASLGRLSAGLAHELNNPASAIKRCAAILEDEFQDAEEAACSLSTAGLSPSQLAAIEALCAAARTTQARPVLTPFEQADREEAFAEWLAGHGLSGVHAESLADTNLTLDALNQIAVSLERPVLHAVLRRVAAGCAIRNLTARIQDSAAQISKLVNAVKGFTHMDQANAAEPVDVISGLANTVEVLRAKASEKSVRVALDLEPDLPRIRGFAAELNQVWGNLVDNALDAAAGGGKVEVVVGRDGIRSVVVRIVDDGPGIPGELRDRIFDPFFTTKPMGQGTGLGLDIARRLVRHNDGAIDFESRPGRTEFRVTLPIAD